MDSGSFDAFVGLSIFACVSVMFVELHFHGHNSKVSLGLAEDDGSWPQAQQWFSFFEHVFNAVFIIDLLLRICFLKQRFLSDDSALFDFLLVSINSINLYILVPLEQTSNARPTVFRLFRASAWPVCFASSGS